MMDTKKTGTMYYDTNMKRMDIQFDEGHTYSGLHCGECFEVYVNGKWQEVRIEYCDSLDWYLVGVSRDVSLWGLKVRI